MKSIKQSSSYALYFVSFYVFEVSFMTFALLGQLTKKKKVSFPLLFQQQQQYYFSQQKLNVIEKCVSVNKVTYWI